MVSVGGAIVRNIVNHNMNSIYKMGRYENVKIMQRYELKLPSDNRVMLLCSLREPPFQVTDLSSD